VRESENRVSLIKVQVWWQGLVGSPWDAGTVSLNKVFEKEKGYLTELQSRVRNEGHKLSVPDVAKETELDYFKKLKGEGEAERKRIEGLAEEKK
jgi:hypothetical protein